MSVKIENGKLCYGRRHKPTCVDAIDVVWAYVQVEIVKTACCTGGFGMEAGRLVLRESSGKNHIVACDRKEDAQELVELLAKLNPQMAVGFTAENKEKFGYNNL